MVEPDCCSNTYFVDSSGVNIRLNLSPKEVIDTYPQSELAQLLSNEPRFYTSSDFDVIHKNITVGHPELGKPILIKMGSNSWSYGDFYKKYTKGIKNDTDGGKSLLDSVKRIITKLGGPPVIFRWGKLSHYNFVNDDNTIDCDALSHWSGATGLLDCCQFNAPMPNRFGLIAYPEAKLEENKQKCNSKGLGMDKYLYPGGEVDGGGYKIRKTNLRKTHKHKKKYKKKNTRRKHTRRKNTRRKNTRRKNR